MGDVSLCGALYLYLCLDLTEFISLITAGVVNQTYSMSLLCRCLETMTTLMDMLTRREEINVGEKILEENENFEVCFTFHLP